MPISALVDLVIGVSRSISVSAMATVGLLHVDVDAPDIADLDAVEQHRAAAAQPGRRAGDAHAQRRRFAAVADRRRPVDEGEGRNDRHQREDADNDVVGFGFHSPLSASFSPRGKIELPRPLAAEIGFHPGLLAGEHVLDRCPPTSTFLLPSTAMRSQTENRLSRSWVTM